MNPNAQLSEFSSPLMPRLTSEYCRLLLITSAYMVNVVGVVTLLYSSPLYWKQPYHISKLSGDDWVKELHYDRIWTEHGMQVHVFLKLQYSYTCV